MSVQIRPAAPMTFFESIILGIVEGFTEFLPISSTAHLVLTSKLLGLETSNFLKSFEIAIQLGAIASVVVLYFKTFLKDWTTNKKIIIAFLPTAIVGATLYGFIRDTLLSSHLVSVYALLLGGVFIIIFEWLHKEKPNYATNLSEITFKKSFLIGCAQSLAIIPGVSRAAATILGGLALGISRKTIVEFSFLLAAPTMLAATVLDLSKNYTLFTSANWQSLAIGFVTSFVVAIMAIKFLLNFIKTNDFKLFGLYRVLLAIMFLFLL